MLWYVVLDLFFKIVYNVGIEYIDMPDNLKSSYQEYTKADLTKLNRTLGS